MNAVATDLFADLQQETWLANRLRQLRANLEGDFPTMKARLRQAIEAQGYEAIIAGRNPDNGRPETFAEAFERIFGEPFHPNKKRGSR
jgi:hypothetical protein